MIISPLGLTGYLPRLFLLGYRESSDSPLFCDFSKIRFLHSHTGLLFAGTCLFGSVLILSGKSLKNVL